MSRGLHAAAAAACHRTSKFVSSFLRPLVSDPSALSVPDRVIYGQLVRVDSWLGSLAKLSDPSDFQPISAGCRSILETAVDLILIGADKSRVQALIDWEFSAKHKHACAVVAFLDGGGVSGEDHSESREFSRTAQAQTTAIRLKHGWLDKKKKGSPKPIHPPRWTGRNLDVDCAEADKGQAAGGFSFRAFYETRYRPICWDVHGSALVTRSIKKDVFPYIAARALDECAELSLIAARSCLKTLAVWSPEVNAVVAVFLEEVRKEGEEIFRKVRDAVQQGVAADGAAPRR